MYPGLLGPRCFSSNTSSNDTGEELLLPSATQIAVLTNEVNDHKALLKIAISLIEIFCASMLGRTSLELCLHFKTALIVVAVVSERVNCFSCKFCQFQSIGCLFCRQWAFDPCYCAFQVANSRSRNYFAQKMTSFSRCLRTCLK